MEVCAEASRLDGATAVSQVELMQTAASFAKSAATSATMCAATRDGDEDLRAIVNARAQVENGCIPSPFSLEFGVQGSGFRVDGLGFRVQGSGFTD